MVVVMILCVFAIVTYDQFKGGVHQHCGKYAYLFYGGKFNEKIDATPKRVR